MKQKTQDEIKRFSILDREDQLHKAKTTPFDLIIIGGGAHPEGYYLAPYNLIAKLVLAKKELPCWKNYGCWTQSNIPKPLREFFHHDQENK